MRSLDRLTCKDLLKALDLYEIRNRIPDTFRHQTPLKFVLVYLTTYLKDGTEDLGVCVCVCEVANRSLFFSVYRAVITLKGGSIIRKIFYRA